MKKFLTTKELILCALFASLTAICSQIAIPLGFTPIPFTLQLFSVFISAIILGPKLGSISQVTYVLVGTVGFPVFAQFSGGINKVLGPTGGYIISFPIAAFIVGYLALKPNIFINALGIILGLICIYGIGTVQLSLITNMSFNKALLAGVIPFVPFDLVKIFLSLVIGMQIRKALIKSSLFSTNY
ncbi:biotin transporter BioY [Clostridium cylindrosporum]|uniref:Biotin transporter n=1 Tax=Clostridium cylindrosporum DSM 605 TaxID=1121307 RepID=A0A0J8DB55_CLOCY|nr:biotin transporter BioY [Clostridium cylindrosporum]KMT21529.1 biotin transporter BioY [Clostridium cylindrosporum DSM 605]